MASSPPLRPAINHAIPFPVKTIMTHQDQYDDAMFDYSMADFDSAITKLRAILAEDAAHFDAQLALAMCHYRQGNYAAAIAEGHKAEALQPKEQLVHTNLSLFYMKAGDKAKAEAHGLQARISSWRGNMAPPSQTSAGDPELQMAQPASPLPAPPPTKLSDQPWKKKA